VLFRSTSARSGRGPDRSSYGSPGAYALLAAQTQKHYARPCTTSTRAHWPSFFTAPDSHRQFILVALLAIATCYLLHGHTY
jgi:hypothetical protein